MPSQVTQAAPPGPVVVSADGAAALFAVDLSSKHAVLNVAVPQLRQLTGSGTSGLRVAVTGPAGYTADAGHQLRPVPR